MLKKVFKLTVLIYSILSLPIGEDWMGLLHAQTITRGPYLQQLGQNGVIIRWRTDVPTQSLVTFNIDSPNNGGATTPKIELDNLSTTEHIVQLKGLQANTKYTYTVGTETKPLASGKDYYFITAPSPTDNRPINIWAMGDFGDNSTEVYEKNQTAVKEQYLKNKSNYTDLWLWLGDNAYCCGTDIEYQRQIFDFYGSNILGNTAFFPVPGNHEYYETATGQVDKKINYFKVISVPTKGEMGGLPSNTKEYYSFNYENIHIIALDSYGLDEGKYRLSDPQSKQYQWLVNDLEASKGKSLWTIITFHHPPYTKRSHDSDGEADLVAIREALVPIFDKYKVDLILNGHSHSYERSHLMKGHVGKSFTFNDYVHPTQWANGKYEKKGDSRPYINKDEGTIYCVVGSAGRLDWNGDPNPHPSSVYSNISIGGSLLFTINDNRLDARWVAADGVIRDNFTVFKNVNKTEKKTLEYGEKIRLTSSWKGSHLWSNGVNNQDFIEISPRKDTIISVVDSLGFLKDNFQISVLPQPVVLTEFPESVQVCVKNSVSVPFSVKNTQLDKWEYQLELSDANGSFTKPLLLGRTNKSPFQIILSDALPEGKNYRFRVRANADFFEEVPSKSFSIATPASLGFVGNKVMPFDTTLTLNLRFNGTPPFTYKITSLPEATTQARELSLKVKPTAAINYTIEKVTNLCGVGTVLSENSVSVLAPLSNEESSEKISIFPNPISDEITIENHTAKPIIGTLTIKDVRGKQVLQKNVSFNQSEKVLLSDLHAGVYIITIKSASLRFSKKIIKN
ncbi:metallophosphoesterase [Emticicia aquatilis]|nr:metallophosphoesterase [Emticicia aquatilis]